MLAYVYFKENYKLIAIDPSQQALNADPKVIWKINFKWNLERAGNTTMFIVIEEVKENIFDFSQGTVKIM